MPQVDDRAPRGAHVDYEIPMDLYHVMSRQYIDDLGWSMNFIGYSMETMMHHLQLIPLSGVPPHYTYIPSWGERLAEHPGGVGASGVSDEDDEDE